MKPRTIRLSTTPTREALAELRLGDIVYLDGGRADGDGELVIEWELQADEGSCENLPTDVEQAPELRVLQVIRDEETFWPLFAQVTLQAGDVL